MLILLAGCNLVIDEQGFFEDYPTQICQRGITCLWEDMPPTVEACVEDRQEVLEERQDTCGPFDKDEAAICMRALRDVDCEDTELRFPEVDPLECAYVYDCGTTSIGTSYY